ncbi:MAG: hypothetical protein M1832_004218 [Thelocarpon impressellum]|nr:MAG: hypothetical protein M1832_004218 [Thelocarpon impressellum]
MRLSPPWATSTAVLLFLSSVCDAAPRDVRGRSSVSAPPAGTSVYKAPSPEGTTLYAGDVASPAGTTLYKAPEGRTLVEARAPGGTNIIKARAPQETAPYANKAAPSVAAPSHGGNGTAPRASAFAQETENAPQYSSTFNSTWNSGSTSDSRASSSSVPPVPTHSLTPAVNPNEDRRQTSNLELEQKLELFYGETSGSRDGQVPADASVATVSIPELKYPAVRLERTAFISDVACDESSAKVTFNDEEAYHVARANWASHGDRFVFVTYHEGCGKSYLKGERSFILVKDFQADHSSLTIRADVEHVGLEGAVDGDTVIDIDLGKWTPASENPLAGYGARELAERWDVSTDISFSTPKGTASTPWGPGSELFHHATANESLEIYCVDCGVNGRVTLTGSVKFSFFKGFKAASIRADGQLHAGLQLGIVAQLGFSGKFKVPIAQVGLAGLVIPGILSVGPEVALAAGASFDVRALGQALAGLKFDWPALSAELNIKDPDASSASGFEPVITKVLRASGGIVATADAYLEVALGVSVSVLAGLFRRSLALVDRPGVVMSLGPGSSEQCPGTSFSLGLRNRVGLDVFGFKFIDLHNWNGPSFTECVA